MILSQDVFRRIERDRNGKAVNAYQILKCWFREPGMGAEEEEQKAVA